MKNLNTLTLAQLTEIYNQHAPKAVKKFSCSREAAIAKVEAVLPKKTAKTVKGTGIGVAIITCLRNGTNVADTLQYVLDHFEGAKTTVKCVYWYASRLNRGLI